MNEYLQTSPIIDWQHPLVLATAEKLACLSRTRFGTARNCFEFVRDEIRHSGDFQLNPVTCRASDVLETGTGFSFAKSHLLAALLRANGIPAGFSYQRLLLDEASGRYCLHGFNTIHLDAYGWMRIDARGNKPGITAEFIPPQERLAYTPMAEGECDLPGNYAEPLPEVVALLQSCASFVEVEQKLPDV